MATSYKKLFKLLMYTTGENGNSAIYDFKTATAEITAFSHAPEMIKF